MKIIYLMSVLFCFSCSAQQNNNKSALFEFNLEEKKTYTTDFYDVFVLAKVDNLAFNIKEKITLSLGIINNGTKDFFIPDYLFNGGINEELFIEVFKKNKLNEFLIYKSPVPRGSSIGGSKRKIFPIKNGQGYAYLDIQLDFTNKISEPGVYKAKVYLDFSNFGYFKKIETSSTVFEVVE